MRTAYIQDHTETSDLKDLSTKQGTDGPVKSLAHEIRALVVVMVGGAEVNSGNSRGSPIQPGVKEDSTEGASRRI